MYTRCLIACSVLVFTAFVAAVILMDHVRLLAGSWAEEASGVTVLALVTIGAMVGAAACGVAAFMCRALGGVTPNASGSRFIQEDVRSPSTSDPGLSTSTDS
jgi:hypothetical protein